MIHHFNSSQLNNAASTSSAGLGSDIGVAALSTTTAVSSISMTQSQLGAQVLTLDSAAFSNLFFLSNQHLQGKPYRGGVPVLFPQFNNLGQLKKHGYVRDMPWQKLAEHTEQTQITSEFGVSVAHIKEWDNGQANAALRLMTSVSEQTLEMRLYVENTGDKSFGFTGGLHPYFSIQNTDKLNIQGLQNTAWQDFADHDNEPDDIQLLGQHIERLYQTAPNIRFANGQRQFEISCTGFDQWMIWNPGRQHAANMPDLENHAWQQFICIEPVIVNNPVVLAAGEQFTGILRIAVVT